jgi:hypothetical protein
MAKKKSHPLPEAAPAPTQGQSLNLALRRIDEEWDKKQTELQKTYNSAMESAWRKYAAALHGHTDNSFNDQYDDDREAALSAWKKDSKAADLRAECDRANLFKRTPQLRGESDDGL